MPTYEFTCPNNHDVEYVLGFDDERPEHCEVCGEELKRRFSTPAITLRGPGFYLTDHRKPEPPSGGLKYVPRSEK